MTAKGGHVKQWIQTILSNMKVVQFKEPQKKPSDAGTPQSSFWWKPFELKHRITIHHNKSLCYDVVHI